MGRIHAGLVLAALWGAGCGDTKEPIPKEPIERHVDGSRIKARVFSTSEGLRWFRQIYDSHLQAPCTWQKAAPDGAYYCVDFFVGRLFDEDGGRFGDYADANCSVPLVSVTRTPGPNTLISRTDGTCHGLQRFHAMGKFWGESFYRRDENGACVWEQTGSSTHYLVGPEVAAGDYFVRGTLQEKQRAKGIKAYVIQGEDGSESFQSLQDTVNDTECTVRLARDGKLRCLPSGESTGALSSAWVDSTCTERAVMTTTPMFCTPPRFAVSAQPEEKCASGLQTSTVGEEVSQIHGSISENNPVCQPFPWQSRHVRYYRPGAELPATNWPEAKEVDLSTHGRLTLRGVEVAGGVKLPRQIFDTQLGTPCSFWPDPSGTLRCYPNSHLLDLKTRFYTDATCTTQAAAVHSSACVIEGYAVYLDNSQGTPRQPHAYHLGAKHEGPLYSGRPGACRELGWTPEEPMYVLGEEIDATSLAEGMESMN